MVWLLERVEKGKKREREKKERFEKKRSIEKSVAAKHLNEKASLRPLFERAPCSFNVVRGRSAGVRGVFDHQVSLERVEKNQRWLKSASALSIAARMRASERCRRRNRRQAPATLSFNATSTHPPPGLVCLVTEHGHLHGLLKDVQLGVVCARVCVRA